MTLAPRCTPKPGTPTTDACRSNLLSEPCPPSDTSGHPSRWVARPLPDSKVSGARARSRRARHPRTHSWYVARPLPDLKRAGSRGKPCWCPSARAVAFATTSTGLRQPGAPGSNLLTWDSAQTAPPPRAVRLDDQRGPRLSATRPTDHPPPRTAWLSGTPLRSDTFGHPPDTSLGRSQTQKRPDRAESPFGRTQPSRGFRNHKPGTPTTGASGLNLLTWGSAQTARPLRAVRLDDQLAQTPRLSATRPRIIRHQ